MNILWKKSLRKFKVEIPKITDDDAYDCKQEHGKANLLQNQPNKITMINKIPEWSKSIFSLHL